ncbi:MAG: hypothetical protein KKI09_04175 [Spirochaetes bacterium]|nr:hypothetical protein [Spirochaetota bacterium]MBU0954606.1 hypothetical protein [Spirochaetota bacterium]
MLKKLVASLIILTLLAVAVFLLGWLPLRVQPGRHSVVVSKINGVRETVLSPGQFFWTAEALLPTNLKVYSFAPVSSEQRVQVSGELPSAAVYSEFLAGQPDFSWEVSLRIAAGIRPQSLPTLVSQFGITDEAALRAYLDTELVRAAEDVRSLLIAAASDPARIQELLEGSLSADFIELIQQLRPQLQVQEATVVSARVPDLAIYHSARDLYNQYIHSYQALVEPALAAASSRAVEDQVRMTSLRRYGELLTEFPVLVEYLALEFGQDR